MDRVGTEWRETFGTWSRTVPGLPGRAYLRLLVWPERDDEVAGWTWEVIEPHARGRTVRSVIGVGEVTSLPAAQAAAEARATVYRSGKLSD